MIASTLTINNTPVYTAQQLADFYGIDVAALEATFAEHASHFTEGEHFIIVPGNEVTTTYWTIQGASLLSMPIDTPQAWAEYEGMVDAVLEQRGEGTSMNTVQPQRKRSLKSHPTLPVVFIDGKERVDSRQIAAFARVRHKHIMQVIRQGQSELEECQEVVLFQTEKLKDSKKGRPEKYALLTEDQCFAIALKLRNTAGGIAYKDAYAYTFSSKPTEQRKVMRGALPNFNVPKTTCGILNITGQAPEECADLLKELQGQRIRYWKSVGMPDDCMDVDEIWRCLSELLQVTRGIRPWWDRDDSPIEKNPDNEAHLTPIMQAYETCCPQYTVARKPLWENAWDTLSQQERMRLLPGFTACKEKIAATRPLLNAINTGIETFQGEIEEFVEYISEAMYTVHGIIHDAMEEHRDIFDLKLIHPFLLPHPCVSEHMLCNALEVQQDIDRVLWLTSVLSLFRKEHADLCDDPEEE